jgi:hypothetical protein
MALFESENQGNKLDMQLGCRNKKLIPNFLVNGTWKAEDMGG